MVREIISPLKVLQQCLVCRQSNDRSARTWAEVERGGTLEAATQKDVRDSLSLLQPSICVNDIRLEWKDMMSLSPLNHLERVSRYSAARTYFFIRVFFGLSFCSSHSFLVHTRWNVLLIDSCLHAQFSHTVLYCIRPPPVMVDLVVAASGSVEFTLVLVQVQQCVTCKQEWIRIRYESHLLMHLWSKQTNQIFPGIMCRTSIKMNMATT